MKVNFLSYFTPFWIRYFLANEMSFCAVCTYNFILVTNRVVGLMPGESLGWEVLIKLCQQKLQSNFFTICHLKYFFQEFPIGETRMIWNSSRITLKLTNNKNMLYWALNFILLRFIFCNFRFFQSEFLLVEQHRNSSRIAPTTV